MIIESFKRFMSPRKVYTNICVYGPFIFPQKALSNFKRFGSKHFYFLHTIHFPKTVASVIFCTQQTNFQEEE